MVRGSSEIEPVTDGAGAHMSFGAGAAQHNRPLPVPDFRDRSEGEGTAPSREETATADDDLVGAVSVLLIADVIQPAELRAVAGEHAIAPCGGEEPTEFRLCPVAPLAPAILPHGREE
jgi:hypothetical protein